MHLMRSILFALAAVSWLLTMAVGNAATNSRSMLQPITTQPAEDI